LLFMFACGAALPAIVTGIATVGDLIELFQDTISPEHDAAMNNCAEAIAALPEGDASLTEVSAACAELTDAYLALETLVSQYRTEKAPRAAPLPAEARNRLEQWYQSRARYQGALE
jgi:hypothetical protein